MYHLSDIKHMERCSKMFYLSRKERLTFQPFFVNQEDIVELLKSYMMIKDCFVGVRNDDPQKAMQAYLDKKHLINARMAYQELRVKVPLLIQEDDKVILYYVFQSVAPKESEGAKIADLLWVLNKINVHVDEVYAISINPDYVRKDELNVYELFITSDYLFRNKNKPGKKISELVELYTRDLDECIEQLKQIEAMDDIVVDYSSACTRGYKCGYLGVCFPEVVDADSIETLMSSQYKYQMKEEGRTTLKDADIERIEGFRQQYAQIMASKLGGLFYDHAALKTWLNDIDTNVVSYLDFEWESYLYPPYQGMKPYDVLVFQYSLHVEQDGELTHINYIGEGDCRMEMIESLIHHIPKEGIILVYNMEGAEKLRLMQLASQFPQYEEALKQIWERMVDLSLPFSTGNVYHLEMKGSYSLKTLVPIFSDYHYEDLSVSTGMDAVATYQAYLKTEGEEKIKLYQALEQYCSLDTYGEYIVYHALKKMVGDE